MSKLSDLADFLAMERGWTNLLDAGGIDLDGRMWWAGQESDPVASYSQIEVAGVHMLIQTTQSGRMLLNGEVVEPASTRSVGAKRGMA